MNIFAFIIIGSAIGWLSHVIAGERGIKLIPSIGVGAAGALVGGILVQYMDLGGSVYMAVLSSLAVLFTINTFRKKDPIFTEA